MGATEQIFVPEIGAFKDVPIIEVHVKVGDAVKLEDPLITLESDKAAMDVPAPVAGTVKALLVKLGDRVSKGSLILTVETGGAERAPAAAGPARPSVNLPPSAASAPSPRGAAPSALLYAGPAVRRSARELGIDLAQVPGSGPKGRIQRADLEAFARAAPAAPAGAPTSSAPAGTLGLPLLPWPQVDFATQGPVEVLALARVRKLSAANLHRNWVMIPHVTNHEDADVTDLEAFRRKLNEENEQAGVKVTMLAFLLKACAAALQKFPEINGSLSPDGQSLVVKKYWNLGFAADTPNGLVVPVVKDVDRKGVLALAQETAALARLARDGKLKLGDLQGGTFTISSLGGIGGTAFTPIINAPEVAILGVSRAAMKPVWDGERFVPRLILPLSLSYDHRVIDGAAAARFNGFLAGVLGDLRRLVL